MARASDSKSEGWGFESLQACFLMSKFREVARWRKRNLWLYFLLALNVKVETTLLGGDGIKKALSLSSVNIVKNAVNILFTRRQDDGKD